MQPFSFICLVLCCNETITNRNEEGFTFFCLLTRGTKAVLDRCAAAAC